MDQLAFAVDPDMGLHPDPPLLAHGWLVHLGVTALSAFFVELGAVMIVASTMVPRRHLDAAGLEMRIDRLEERVAETVGL